MLKLTRLCGRIMDDKCQVCDGPCKHPRFQLWHSEHASGVPQALYMGVQNVGFLAPYLDKRDLKYFASPLIKFALLRQQK